VILSIKKLQIFWQKDFIYQFMVFELLLNPFKNAAKSDFVS